MKRYKDFKINESKDEEEYVLGYNLINDIKIDDEIFNEELFDYRIEDRDNLIDNLIDWISEANNDKEMMKEDLKMLMNLSDDYIFSSNRTNEYISKEDGNFNETCKDLLYLQANYKKDRAMKNLNI